MSYTKIKSLEEYFHNYRKSVMKSEVFWGEVAVKYLDSTKKGKSLNTQYL